MQYAHSINIIDFLKDEPISGSTTIYSDTFLPSSPPVETSDSSIDKFADELTLLDSFPSDFEDDIVFERFTFEPSPIKDISFVIINDPVLERIPCLFLPPFEDRDSLLDEADAVIGIDINPVCEKFSDELAHLDPFPLGNKDVCFDLGANYDEIEFLLSHDPMMSVDSILEGFTDEPPLGENDDDDDLFDLSTRNVEWRTFLYDVPFDDAKSFDMTIFMDEVFPLRH
ncbi:hypothetical protein Tco_1498307 [Tanacetum coccineum]